MRYVFLILACCTVIQFGEAQKRFLVSPNSGIIPLSPEQNSAEVIKAITKTKNLSAATCPDKYTFGYHPDTYTPNWKFGGRHRELIGQWFIAPASGEIDTIFWINEEVGEQTIFIRIHTSNVGPTYGPGIRPGPFNPPCQNWGYWINTNDCDQGIAAFVDDATHPEWISTMSNLTTPSTPPFGEEIWGFGGYPKFLTANSIHNIVSNDLAPIVVNTGDKFFISMRVRSGFPGILCGHKDVEIPTEWSMSGFKTGANDPDYPSRNWVFYEHDQGPSNCAGFPADSIKRGWVARGGFGADSLSVAAYNIWYVMSVLTNAPPIIEDVTLIHTTFDPGAKTIQATIIDCNPANPGSAVVSGAVIRYSVNNISQPDIPMNNIGGDTWEGTIPPQIVGNSVQYRILATDLDSAVGQSRPISYAIVELGNKWYSVDTAVVCVKEDIRTTGTPISPSLFFNPGYTTSGTEPKNNGTAGPFDMGGNFTLFADTFRYAWIGVNGAISLTKTTDDTNDVNSNGFYTSTWSFPQNIVHQGRNDSINIEGMPRMFIAPFWADHILEDETATYGNILYGNNGNPCKFIVEWDSIGKFDVFGSSSDETTFRVILNRCDGTVEFQYNNVGTQGLDYNALIGMQYDTSSFAHANPYLFINKLGYPGETMPRNNWCVKMLPNIGSSVRDGWNLVSVAGIPIDGNYAKTHLFPQATSGAFGPAPFFTRDTLKNGEGYWLKFIGDQRAGGVPALWNSNVVANVNNNWNIIGSTSGFVHTNTIVMGGATAVTSPFWGYEKGYHMTSTISPGKGYWVKVAGAGTLTMTASAASPKAPPTAAELGIDGMNTITIRDSRGKIQVLYVGEESQLKQDISYFELPPVPPVGAFDARFSASGRMVETYPGKIEHAVEFPITVQSATYPITVNWNLNEMEFRNFEIVVGTKAREMRSKGEIVINDAKVNTVIIRIMESNTPKVFALSQNYPNPFNPVTRFRVDVAKTSQVEVAVYDILGRKIAILINEEHVAGSYTLEWDGKDNRGLTAPTGMYFIRMTAGEFTDSKKVTFMK